MAQGGSVVDKVDQRVYIWAVPLTKQIIEEVVRREIKSEMLVVRSEVAEVKSELINVNQKVDILSGKIDNLTGAVSDLAGQFQTFGQEQTVLSSQMANRTDRVEDLEKKVFGRVMAA